METKSSDGGTEYGRPPSGVLSPILDTEECAALLRCSTDHLEHLAATAVLPAYKFGRSWVFHRDLLISAVGELCAARYLARKSDPECESADLGVVPGEARPTCTERPSSPPVIEPKKARPRGRPRVKVVIPD